MIVPFIPEGQCGDQKKGTVVPTAVVRTTHVKLVEVELSEALNPLAVQLLPLVVLWAALSRRVI